VLPDGGFAADPQPYAVTLEPTNQGPLDQALQASSNLIGLREKAPVGPFALVFRARDDQARLETALNSYGYYGGKVTIRIAGRTLDDPGLPAALDAATGEVPVTIGVATGPLFHLRRVALEGAPTPAARDALKLKPGDPAVAAEVLAAQGRMLEALRDEGHALAKVSTPTATLAPDAQALDISYDVKPGPRVDLGPITVGGLDRVEESYVRRRLLVHQGERFNPARIEKAREDLAQTGVFSTVRIQAPEQLDPAGQLPLTVDVIERPRHVVGFNAAFSTDLGFTAGVTWSHRNLFGQAERLDLGAAITQLGGSASRGAGYNVTAALTKPDLFVRDQDLIFNLQGIKENLEAYDRTAVLGGVTLRRKLSETWTVSAGLQAQQSRIAQEGITRDYTLLQTPLAVRYDSTGKESLLDPTHGIKASATITPTASLGQNGTDFLILQTTGSTYFDLGEPGRSVLALRGTLASVQGATTFELPPDQRLYAGGSATVRGYKYQSISPKFPDGRPTGGTSLAAYTVEFRQRILESWGAAVFVDAGQVGAGSSPLSGNLRAGAGAGARYYSPIGPIRVDVAVPLNKQRGDDTFELYIGIGQAF
jgi:translocation and assembly module TamA